MNAAVCGEGAASTEKPGKSSAARCYSSFELKTPVSQALREVLCSEHWESNQQILDQTEPGVT